MMPLFYSPLSFYWRTPRPILLLRLRYSNLRAIAFFRSRSRLLPRESNNRPAQRSGPLGTFAGPFLLLFNLRAFSLLPFGRLLAPDLRRGLGCLITTVSPQGAFPSSSSLLPGSERHAP